MIRTIALALLLAGCQEKEAEYIPGVVPETGTVLTTVNGSKITQDQLDATIAQFPEQLRQQLEQSGQMGQVQEQLVIGELLYREALIRNLHKDKDVLMTIALVERNALADALLDKIVAERADDKRIQSYYEDHAVQYARKQVSARLLVVKTEAEATELLAKIEAGEDFAALATANSIDPTTKAKGGELGWMSERDFAEPFKDQVFAAEKGAIVGPFPTPQATLIFKIEDKRDKIPLADVKADIVTALTTEIAQEYVEEMKKGAKISSGSDAAVASGDAATPAPAEQGE